MANWKDQFPKKNRYFETENGILYCADSLQLLPQLPSESVDLIVTDPPYGISQKDKKISRRALSSKSAKKNADIQLDFGEWDRFETTGDFFKFTETWFKEAVRILKPKCWFYVFFDRLKIGFFDLILAPKYEIKSRTIFTWIKSNPVPSFRKVNWVSATEFVWVGSKGESKVKNFLKQTDMFNYMITPNKSAYGVTDHPTEKPETLIERFITTSSCEDDVVLDPFLGSGTTATVAEKVGRRWIGIEKSEEFCEMAKKRLKGFSGLRKKIEQVKKMTLL